MESVESFAKKTFLALQNPYHTVEEVYPNAIDSVRISMEQFGNARYVGCKQTSVIPQTLLEKLNQHGFLLHTRDKMSLGGRAVDMSLRNPLTGNPMTGSSSGTALNVFYHINDLGVGTDGGGSVLAPAASLNLYGFISPLIEEAYVNQFRKTSTDGISFSPSIGLISREWKVLKEAAVCSLDCRIPGNDEAYSCSVVKRDSKVDVNGKRSPLISYVLEVVKPGTILCSEEGPVDVNGLGDTVFGHFDEDTQESQRRSGKGLMRVANMCNVSAIVIPQKGLGRCMLFLCDSNPRDIMQMFAEAEKYLVPQDELVERYFGDLNKYWL